MSGLINAPPGLATIRQRLFYVSDPMMLSHGDYEAYWPYISDVWSKRVQGPVNKAGERVIYYICQLGRKENAPRVQENALTGSSGVRKRRNKPTCVGATCQTRLKVTISSGEKPDYRLEWQDDAEHSHGLPFSDTLKTRLKDL